MEPAELPVGQRIGAEGWHGRTGHYPEWYGDAFRNVRTEGLNPARGGLSRGSYVAKRAIRNYGAVVVSFENVGGIVGNCEQ